VQAWGGSRDPHNSRCNQPPAAFSRSNSGPIRFPISSPSACNALIGLIITLEFDHLAGRIELDEVDALDLRFPDIGAHD
jgi:hypothetical protein